MRSQISIFMLLALPLAGPAFSQDVCSTLSDQCACASPLASFSAGSAVLSNLQGSVQVTAVAPGTNPSSAFLTVGDSALVLAGGSATLNFGPTCTVALNPQSSLVIRELNGCACASVVEAMTSASTLTEGGSGATEPADGATGPGIGGDNGGGDGVNSAVLVGGVVAAGAGAAAYFAFAGGGDDDDDDQGSLE